MKRFFHLIVFWMLPVVLFAQASDYHKFPTSNAYWREYFGGWEVYCRGYQEYIDGDTLINGTNYKKIHEFGVMYATIQGNCISTVTGIFDGYHGALFDDTLARKVYLVPSGKSEPELLYDFTLEIGDTLPTTLNNDPAVTHNYVSDIDSILIGNEYHKRFWISCLQSWNPGPYVQIIEGIGSTYGLFTFLYPPFEFGTQLLCFRQNEITLFPDTTTSCELVTGLPESKNTPVNITVQPNPFTYSQAFTLPGIAREIELELFDTFSRKVFDVKNHLSSSILLERGNLQAGVYFYRLTADGISVNGKTIIR